MCVSAGIAVSSTFSGALVLTHCGVNEPGTQTTLNIGLGLSFTAVLAMASFSRFVICTPFLADWIPRKSNMRVSITWMYRLGKVSRINAPSYAPAKVVGIIITVNP